MFILGKKVNFRISLRMFVCFFVLDFKFLWVECKFVKRFSRGRRWI